MAEDDRRLPAALLAVTLVWCLGLTLLGAHDGLLFLVPALLLAAPLAVRLYPGEEALHALTSRPAARPRYSARVGAPAARAMRSLPRGALLIATSLAKRGPPPLLARN